MDKTISSMMKTQDILEGMYLKNRWPAVIVLEGEKVQRQDILSSFIQLVFCQNKLRCGVCESCLLLKANTHPDIHMIQPEQIGHAIKIEQIRDLLDVCLHTPLIAEHQLVVIEHAEALNVNAANALLKVLEEPSLKTHFMLLVDNGQMLIPTIRSRAWLLNGLGRSSPPDVREQLLELQALLMSFLDEQISMARLLDYFAGQALEQSLLLLQCLSHRIISDKTMASEEQQLKELAFLAMAPMESWWQFYDLTVEFRQNQTSLQANLVLSRLFLILKGFY